MRDLYYASITVKLYYLFLLWIALWAIYKTAVLVRQLFSSQASRRLSSSSFDDPVPNELVAAIALSGSHKEMMAIQESPGLLQTTGPAVDWAIARCESAIYSFRALASLTVIMSVLSVVADAVPAYEGEMFGRATINRSQALYLAAERLTTRLSVGLLVAAILTVVYMLLEQILQRRRSAWKLLVASRQRARPLEGSPTTPATGSQ